MHTVCILLFEYSCTHTFWSWNFRIYFLLYRQYSNTYTDIVSFWILLTVTYVVRLLLWPEFITCGWWVMSFVSKEVCICIQIKDPAIDIRITWSTSTSGCNQSNYLIIFTDTDITNIHQLHLPDTATIHPELSVYDQQEMFLKSLLMSWSSLGD